MDITRFSSANAGYFLAFILDDLERIIWAKDGKNSMVPVS
jgi:transposase InsO family protein